MNNAINEVLTQTGGNYILPFFWMRGESEAVLREEMRRVRECGIRAVCVEARPHPDFLGARWWQDLDVVMDEARQHQMQVWVLDDVHFPTGVANHAYRDHYPEQAKLYLAERHIDVLGPQRRGSILIGPLLGQDGQLLGILACPRPDGNERDVDLSRAVDLTGLLHQDMVQWDVPAGFWRIFVLYRTRQGGGQAHYMNIVSRESVKVLLDEVYEPHYQRYQADFGGTFAGFFSDEPEFGNVLGYDFTETLGTANRRLPWSAELESQLAGRWQERFLANLPALWYAGGEGTGQARFQYMDEATRLVASCFSTQVGSWCERHHVEYIGHLIEDDNAHARLGCSLGHYFRALSGQHMAGIDVVLLQIMPGFDQVIHQWIASDRDGEFFHYALAKLGSSHAHIDPKKQGRAMCEIYGAYGWAEDIALMKFLTDHMLVRGINTFVPHAFSPKDFPDRDCPPHFYAHNKNPQFRCFAQLMLYTNRLAHLLNHGRHLAQAAVLYHGEAEWAGQAMLTQKPVKSLLQNQIDCDIIPLDALTDIVPLPEWPGWFRISQGCYGELVVPYAQFLPQQALARLRQLHDQGVRVLFIEDYPQGFSDQAPFAAPGPSRAELETQIGSLPCAALDDLPTIMRGHHLAPFQLAEPNAWLRTLAYWRNPALCLMLMNEHPFDRIDSQAVVYLPDLVPDLDCSGLDRIFSYDAMANKLYTSGAALSPDGRLDLQVHLEPGQSRFYILMSREEADRTAGDAGRQFEYRLMADERAHTELPALEACVWSLAKATSEQYPAFEPAGMLPAASWPNLNGPDQFPSFSGYFRYQTNFDLDQSLADQLTGGTVSLLLALDKDSAEVWLNGEYCGMQLAAPYMFDLSRQLHPGSNQLSIDVANTLAWSLHDGQSTHMLWKPTGLLAAPRLLTDT